MNAINCRRNPGSIAEMLAIVAERNAMYAPKSDEQLALDYPDDDADDDPKWFDGDPARHDEERILERVEATVERRGFQKIG